MEVVSTLRAHYYMQKHKDEETKKAIWTTIDAVSFFIPGGKAATGGMRALFLVANILNKTSSVSGVLANVTEEELINKYGENGKTTINALNIISAATGLVDLGVTGTTRFLTKSTDDLVEIGAFYRKNQTLVDSDPNFKPIKELYDSFDDEILRLIDNAGDMGGAILPRYPREFVEYVNTHFSLSQRQAFDRARQFYQRFNPNFNPNELRGIDFDAPVELVSKRNTVLYQMATLDDAGNPKFGSYFFENINEDVTKLGIGDLDKIKSAERVKIKIVINDEIEFLKSKTVNIDDWDPSGMGEIFRGGAIQLYSPSARTKIVSYEIIQIY